MRNYIITRIVVVMLVFVFAAGLSNAPAQYDGTNTMIITITEDRHFEPDSATINPGDTVEWRNASAFNHSVTTDPLVVSSAADVESPPGAETFNSGTIIPGSRYMYTFTVPGTYRYTCIFHEREGMAGRVTVRQTPIQ